jgi:hypothetical protein
MSIVDTAILIQQHAARSSRLLLLAIYYKLDPTGGIIFTRESEYGGKKAKGDWILEDWDGTRVVALTGSRIQAKDIEKALVLVENMVAAEQEAARQDAIIEESDALVELMGEDQARKVLFKEPE